MTGTGSITIKLGNGSIDISQHGLQPGVVQHASRPASTDERIFETLVGEEASAYRPLEKRHRDGTVACIQALPHDVAQSFIERNASQHLVRMREQTVEGDESLLRDIEQMDHANNKNVSEIENVECCMEDFLPVSEDEEP